jgi:hypothetical protein
MKPVKNLVFALLLVSTIVFNTFAGEVEVPGAYTPPPPRSTTTTTTEEPTTTETTDTQQTTVDTSDYLIYEALAALLSVY